MAFGLDFFHQMSNFHSPYTDTVDISLREFSESHDAPDFYCHTMD
jgi:hypothetical protein